MGAKASAQLGQMQTPPQGRSSTEQSPKTAWAQGTGHGGTDEPWSHVIVLWDRARPDISAEQRTKTGKSKNDIESRRGHIHIIFVINFYH